MLSDGAFSASVGATSKQYGSFAGKTAGADVRPRFDGSFSCSIGAMSLLYGSFVKSPAGGTSGQHSFSGGSFSCSLGASSKPYGLFLKGSTTGGGGSGTSGSLSESASSKVIVVTGELEFGSLTSMTSDSTATGFGESSSGSFSEGFSFVGLGQPGSGVGSSGQLTDHVVQKIGLNETLESSGSLSEHEYTKTVSIVTSVDVDSMVTGIMTGEVEPQWSLVEVLRVINAVANGEIVTVGDILSIRDPSNTKDRVVAQKGDPKKQNRKVLTRDKT